MQTDDRVTLEEHVLARRHALTLYDASYLWLALARAVPLITLDSTWRAASGHE